MIKSLVSSVTSKTSYTSFASVTVQPKPATSTIFQAKPASVSTTAAIAALPAKQAVLPITALKTDSMLKVSKPTVSNLSSLISSKLVLPLRPGFNVIMPVKALNLDASRVVDPRLNQGFVSTTTKFQPYESLTGVSHERPEVVMLTNFQPLFNRDASHAAPHFINSFEATGQQQFMTDAGKYMDAQFQMRNLRTFNMQQYLGNLKSTYPYLKVTFEQRTSDFVAAVDNLKGEASFLLNLVRVLGEQKRQLDLRHDLYQVKPNEIAEYITNNYAVDRIRNAQRGPDVLSSLVQTGQKARYNCVDCLVDVGFDADSVRNTFSSTKIWAQMMIELKAMLRNHSLKFLDVPLTYYRNDRNATTINQPSVKRFDLADNLPQLPSMDELIKLQLGNASKSIGLLQPVFTSIYQNVFFKNEEARLAALAHLLCREYRYSAGLGLESVQTRLQNFYNYQVAEVGNQSVFDALLGRFGNNITDLPAATDASLGTLAQFQAGQVGVLTFESKYIEGDTGTLSPGGEYYFDRILEDTDGQRFDTSGIDALSKRLQDHVDNFTILSDQMNMLSIPVYTARRAGMIGKIVDQHFLTNAGEIIHEMSDGLINPRTGAAHTYQTNDRLGAVFSQAKKDNRVKTILFLYTLARISRTYTNNVPFLSSASRGDNTPLVDYLIDQLVNALEGSVPESRSTIQLLSARGLDRGLNTSSMTRDSIKHSLKSGTQTTRLIEHFMSGVIAQFRNRSKALSGTHTRYSGYLDTVVMMLAFDFAIGMVARYSNQQLVGVHRGLTKFAQGQATFAISQTSTNHRSSFEELTQRVAAEENLTRQMVLTVLNTMRNLGGSLKGISNYLNSGEATSKLREIFTSVGNDPVKLRLLLNEQQIMLLASTTDSLVTAASKQSFQQNDSYKDNGSRENHQVALLDESDIPPEMRQALMGYFGSGDFASVRGNNKRIMTVGVPLGFAERLKQKVNIRKANKNSFHAKQNDIVYVTVYKVDMQNGDIVYKPVRFMFELSRFPTRFTTKHWLPMPAKPTINDIVNAIPTQCFDSNPAAGTSNGIASGIEYASTTIARSSGLRSARSAFGDETYSFLTSRQKAEILHNHVVSQLLEVYVKLMTGVNVAEHTFYMSESPDHVEAAMIQTLTEHSLAHMAERINSQKATVTSQKAPPVKGVLFGKIAKSLTLTNASGIAGTVSSAALFRNVQGTTAPKSLEQQQVNTNIGAHLDALGHQHVPMAAEQLRTINSFSNALSTLSSIDALNHKILGPKDFDRVFNIIVDPRDFEIDVNKTMETPHGRQALDLLLQHGDVVPSDPYSAGGSQWFNQQMQSLAAENSLGRSFPQGRLPGNINNFRYRDRDKNQGDLIADKYFVTIETYDEEEA